MDSPMEEEMLLEKYLQDKLTELERQEFDLLFKNNPEFRKEVEFHIDAKKAITAEEDANFRNILSKFESEARELEQRSTVPESSVVKGIPRKWLVAASVALLVGLTYFFSANQSMSSQEMYDENFSPYRNVTYPITRSSEELDEKGEAFVAYSKGDYEVAVPIFSKLYIEEKQPYYLFYKANALIQLKKAEEAIPLLEKHLGTDDSLTDKSNWYLAMAYLQIADSEKAKQALKKVVETQGYKHEEAKRLLDAF
ncbi:hypothetical protein [uncultured Zobellia sp.]|uniref:tetratricopeptide repeat protein n=1 Tax=uncultured Zobellia sp. TaxID=255433 RepID=UPI002594FF46|nr:hypothetical protein [uncultured Zobellia sp.]